jgi:hypothetical protein
MITTTTAATSPSFSSYLYPSVVLVFLPEFILPEISY